MNTYFNYILFACLFLGAVGVTDAYSQTSKTQEINQEIKPHAINLDSYIKTALEQNAMLESAYESYQAALHKAPQVSALANPTLKYGYFIDSVETRVGPQQHKVGIAQSFPWFGTLSLRAEVANHEAKAELMRFVALKNKLVFDLTTTYAELAYLSAASEITNQTLGLVESWERVLNDRFRTGTATHSDLVKVQVELGKLEDRTKELLDRKLPLKDRFRSLLGLSDPISISVEKNYLSSTNDSLVEPFEHQQILQGNPELLMLDAVIEARKTGVNLAEKEFYPDFSLGLDYVATGSRDVAGGGDDALLASVGFSLPIYQSKNRAAVAEAKSRERSILQRKADTELRLKADLSKIHFELRDAERKITLYQKTLIPKARESIDASFSAYESSEASFLDVLDSEQRLLEFMLILKRAEADRIIAAAEQQKLAGGQSEVNLKGESK